MNKVLVIPAVSSGNIPQLAVDLLIHTLNAQLTSRLDDQYMYPFAGPVDTVDGIATPSTTVSTSGDVYATEAGDMTIVQLRSPTLPGYRQRFVEKTLLPFISEQKFSHVLVVGSSNAALRTHVTDATIAFYSNSLADQLSGLSFDSNTVHPLPDQLPESGIVLDLLQQVGNSCGIVCYAYEGDNFGDAEVLANQVSAVLGLGIEQWVRPQSWKGAYGKEIPLGMEQGLYT